MPDRPELGAQAADMYVDRSRFDEAVVAPDALEQTVARDHSVLVLHEKPQQLELAPRQPDSDPVNRYGDGVEIRRQPAAAYTAGFAPAIVVRRGAAPRGPVPTARAS